MLLAHAITDAWLTDLDLFRLIPMIISRMIVSLKKAASSRQPHMSMGIPTGLPMNPQDTSSSRSVGGIQLSVFRN